MEGADAKDLDDAIAVKRLENGNVQLGVYIADVSYYATADSPMDVEALERGTSVYLVDRVIPMIPHRLSNGICSLNPHVDRLALGCEMEIDAEGKVVNHEIFECVIQSKERLTNTDVNDILVHEVVKLLENFPSLFPFFDLMNQLAAVFWSNSMKRDAFHFVL